MRIVRLTLGAALAMGLVAAGFAHADVDQTGTSAASFLTLGSGARILSMGGATLGLGDDLAASAWNPAALGWMERGEIVLSHSGLGNGTSQEWAGFGGGWNGMRWALSGLYQGEGSFDGRDASNLSTGSFNVSSFAFGAHLARRFGDRVTVGAGAKAVNENLGTVSGFGATFDFGASVRAGDFGLGLAAQNLGGQMKYDGSVYSFPGSFGAGVSYSMPNTGLKFALDANFPQSYYNDVRVGAEWTWNDMLALRAGYRKELVDGNIADDQLSGPTFGMGAGRNGLWIDYGYLVSSGGQGEHRIGLRFTPGGSSGYGQTSEPATERPKPSAPKTTASKPAASTPAKTAAKPATPPAVKPATVAAKEDGDENTPVPTSTPAAARPTDAAAAKPTSTTPASTAPATPKPAPVKVGSKPTPTRIGDLAPPPPPAPAKTATAVTPAPKPAAPKVETKVGDMPAPKPVEAKPAETKPAETKTESKPAETKTESKPAESSQQVAALQPPAGKEAPKVEEKPAEKPAEKPVEAKKSEEKKKPEPAKTEPRPNKVKVKNGETLKVIAARYGLTPAAIMMENNMTSEQVKPGQTLKLPPEN